MSNKVSCLGFGAGLEEGGIAVRPCAVADVLAALSVCLSGFATGSALAGLEASLRPYALGVAEGGFSGSERGC